MTTKPEPSQIAEIRKYAKSIEATGFDPFNLLPKDTAAEVLKRAWHTQHNLLLLLEMIDNSAVERPHASGRAAELIDFLISQTRSNHDAGADERAWDETIKECAYHLSHITAIEADRDALLSERERTNCALASEMEKAGHFLNKIATLQSEIDRMREALEDAKAVLISGCRMPPNARIIGVIEAALNPSKPGEG